MNIEQVIYSVLSGNDAVSDLIDDRITPLVRPQGQALPAITYQLVDNIIDHDVKGPTGWRQARWQINCFSNDYDQMITLAKAVEAILDGYKAMGIDHVFFIDEGEIEPIDAENEQFTIYVKRMDFEFSYND